MIERGVCIENDEDFRCLGDYKAVLRRRDPSYYSTTACELEKSTIFIAKEETVNSKLPVSHRLECFFPLNEVLMARWMHISERLIYEAATMQG